VRTNESAIRDVISTSLDSEQINAFAADASLWVTEELGGAGLSNDRLELIERYLACALIRLRDLGLQSATFDDVAEQYQVDPVVTDYLLRAAAFDPTGRVRDAFVETRERGPMRVRVGTGFVDELT
jgi:hypothetical protein